VIRIGLLLIGAWTGLVGMLVHRQATVAGGVVWPWGLVLVLIVTAAVVHAANGLFRVGAAWFALGWALILMLERIIGGTSYLVATDWVGWTFMLGGLGVITVEVARGSRLGA